MQTAVGSRSGGRMATGADALVAAAADAGISLVLANPGTSEMQLVAALVSRQYHTRHIHKPSRQTVRASGAAVPLGTRGRPALRRAEDPMSPCRHSSTVLRRAPPCCACCAVLRRQQDAVGERVRPVLCLHENTATGAADGAGRGNPTAPAGAPSPASYHPAAHICLRTTSSSLGCRRGQPWRIPRCMRGGPMRARAAFSPPSPLIRLRARAAAARGRAAAPGPWPGQRAGQPAQRPPRAQPSAGAGAVLVRPYEKWSREEWLISR
jgi:hypothetical protein